MSLDAFTGEIDGLSTLVLVPAVTEAAPAAVREGLARRRLVAMGQPCPCGAVLVVPNRAARRAAARARRELRVQVEHEPTCAAVSPATVAHLTGGAA